MLPGVQRAHLQHTQVLAVTAVSNAATRLRIHVKITIEKWPFIDVYSVFRIQNSDFA